jgi:hypothetical protein
MIHKCIHDDHTHPLRKCNIRNSPAVAPDQLQTKNFNSHKKYKKNQDPNHQKILLLLLLPIISGSSYQEILLLRLLPIPGSNVKRFSFFCSCNVRKINVKRFLCPCNSRISTCQEMILILLLLMQKNLMALCQRKSCNSNQRSIQVQRSQSSSTGSLKPRAQKVIRLDKKNAYYRTSRTMKAYKEEERKKLQSKLVFAAAGKKTHRRGEKKNSPRIGKRRKKKK